jgi:CheY-like chemotaxis protein
VGIPQDALTRLFSSFVQLDSSTSRKFGGTGLGLVICKKLIEGMHGSIGVHSQAGRGSLFWFELPLEPSSRQAASVLPLDGLPAGVALPDTVPGAMAIEAPALAEAALPGDSPPPPLLLVEDHPINQKLALVLLQRLGFAVELASDGAQGVAMAAARPYALILMDVQMPVMNGFDATRAIRAGAGPNAATPIIALTANAMQSDKDMCLEAGMNDFLTKPFNKDVLLACMQQHLARAPVA